jgi:asparagine N-glycosylation enzyme membrane subunit Stt3
MGMSILDFVIILVVLGLAWYLAENYLPLPGPIKVVLRAVGIIVLIFLVLALFGVAPMPFKLT